MVEKPAFNLTQINLTHDVDFNVISLMSVNMSDAPLDMNQIAALAAKELVKDAVKSTYDTLSKPIAKLWKQATTDFEEMSKKAYAKNAYVRILSSKQTPVELDKIYVETKFMCEHESVDELTLMQRVRDGQKVLVVGDGGLGKTFFVKRFWRAVFDHQSGKIPVFVSLRDLNEMTDDNLSLFLRRTIFPSANSSEQLFDYFCRRGTFVFILDGYDEAVEAKRSILQRQLIDFTNKYTNCGFLVSTRETDSLTAWDDFFEYNICRFNREQTLELIKKVDFDVKTKTKFSKQITPEFFEKNESFLSNPLLALMMLITFRDNAKLPTKMSNFYENAFQTLYSLHDGLKGAYLRERKLEKDTFRKLFSIFCLFTYYSHATSFNDNELRDYVEKSKKYLKLDVDTTDVVKEFRESTNLLQLEGFQYSFIHRSFQEYFSAYCAVKIITENSGEFLKEFFNRSYDQTFKLAHEIHSDCVEEEFLIPTLKKLEEDKKIRKQYSSTLSTFQILTDIDWELGAVLSVSNGSKSGKIRLTPQSLGTGEFREKNGWKYISTISRLFGNVDGYKKSLDTKDSLSRMLADKLVKILHSGDATDYIDKSQLRNILSRIEDEGRADIYIGISPNGDSIIVESREFSAEIVDSIKNDLTDFRIRFVALEDDLRSMSRFCAKLLDKLKRNADDRSTSIDKLLGI